MRHKINMVNRKIADIKKSICNRKLTASDAEVDEEKGGELEKVAIGSSFKWFK